MKTHLFLLSALCFSGAAHAAEQTSWKFDFGSGAAALGTLKVTPDTVFTVERGYGFEPGARLSAIESTVPNAAHRDFITSDKPFSFSVALPEGNYSVTAILGDAEGKSVTTIKAEARRLMLEKVQTAPGQFVMPTFTVNVRRPQIAEGRVVGLNTREKNALNWDDKLTLEFSNRRPCVAGLKITKTDDAITLFLAGDSTVTDQAAEPWSSWGQMLPRFFKPGVAVANHAESGRALYSFRSERRFDKILSTIKPGDYLFIQFGHNDQKDKSPGSGPFTTYKQNLKQYIVEARKKGALPVLVTPMERRRWDGDKPLQTLADFAEAARQTGQEENVPVIDLHAMSLRFYGALGPEKSKKAFVHYAAGTFSGQNEALKDDTHFNAYGGYQLAKSVVEGIKTQVPVLAKFLTDDTVPFDPSHPDDVEKWSLPLSSATTVARPEGN